MRGLVVGGRCGRTGDAGGHVPGAAELAGVRISRPDLHVLQSLADPIGQDGDVVGAFVSVEDEVPVFISQQYTVGKMSEPSLGFTCLSSALKPAAFRIGTQAFQGRVSSVL